MEHRDAASEWAQAFARGLIKKMYLAVVSPAPADVEGVIVSEVYKGVPNGSSSRERMISRPSSGRPRKNLGDADDDRAAIGAKSAVTEWKLLHRSSSAALLLLQPVTGRTHQLRVHCADVLKCPVVGDHKYGASLSQLRDGGESVGSRLQLHAAALVVPHNLVTPQLLKLCMPVASDASAPAANAVVRLGDGRLPALQCLFERLVACDVFVRVLICASMPLHMQQALQVIQYYFSPAASFALCSSDRISHRIAGHACSKKLIQCRCAGNSSAIMSCWSVFQTCKGTIAPRNCGANLRARDEIQVVNNLTRKHGGSFGPAKGLK